MVLGHMESRDDMVKDPKMLLYREGLRSVYFRE